MHEQYAQAELKNARAARNVFAVLSVLCAIAVVALVGLLWKQETKIVLTPTFIPSGTVAVGAEVDGKYLEGLARDAMYSILNVSPEATDYARDALARIAAPDSRTKIITIWDDILLDVRKREISTAFYPAIFNVNTTALSVVVDGDLLTFLGSTMIAREKRRYQIAFKVVNGSARIADISGLELPS